MLKKILFIFVLFCVVPSSFAATKILTPSNLVNDEAKLQINATGIEAFADVSYQRINMTSWNITFFLKEAIRNDIYACYMNLSGYAEIIDENQTIYYNCSVTNFKNKWLSSYNINNNLLTQLLLNATNVPIKSKISGLDYVTYFSYLQPFSYIVTLNKQGDTTYFGFSTLVTYVPDTRFNVAIGRKLTEMTMIDANSNTLCPEITCEQWLNVSDNKRFNLTGSTTQDSLMQGRFILPLKTNWVLVTVEGQQEDAGVNCGLAARNQINNSWVSFNITACAANTDVTLTYNFSYTELQTFVRYNGLFEPAIYTNDTAANTLRTDLIEVLVDYNETSIPEPNSFTNGYRFENNLDINGTHDAIVGSVTNLTYSPGETNNSINSTRFNTATQIGSTGSPSYNLSISVRDVQDGFTIATSIFNSQDNPTRNINATAIQWGTGTALSSQDYSALLIQLKPIGDNNNFTVTIVGNLTTHYVTNYTFTNNTWTRIIVRYDGDYLVMYADGNVVGNFSVFEIMPSATTALNGFSNRQIQFLAGYANGFSTIANYYSGQIDNTYFWKGALSDADVQIVNTNKQDPFPANTIPTISNIQNISITNESATITWTTDVASNTSVFYGTTTSLGSVANTVDSVTSHSQSLTNLLNNTLYYYNVSSCNAYGCTNSSQYSFWTLNTTGIQNSCTYSGSGTWIIQIADNCNITATVDMDRANITLNGSPTNQYRLNITDGTIKNYSNLTLLGNNITIWGYLG